MKYKVNTLTICTIFVLLSSCSTDIQDYQQTTPKLDIKQYFTGHVSAWGILQDYSNKVTRRFCVDIEGTWQDDVGQLAEVFYFDDGEVSTRNWQLIKFSDGIYQGTAEDVIGTASGQQSGFSFHWNYDLSIPIDGENYIVHMDDWMYQIDHNRVFNLTKMYKFTVQVAEISIFFDKSSKDRCPSTLLN